MTFQKILERLTKATEKQRGLPLSRTIEVEAVDLRELIHHFNRIDEELRESKQREFDYRAECQNVVSAARLEADEIAKGVIIEPKKATEDISKVIEKLEENSTFLNWWDMKVMVENDTSI